jgi:anti-sigma factor RsiW
MLEIIVEADPETLEDGLSGNGEHAGHLKSCPGCADAARAVLALNASLVEGLAAEKPSTPLDRALRAAAAEAERRGTADRRRLWRGLVPLAAAASVAGLLAIRSVGISPDGLPGEAYQPIEMTARATATEVGISAPEGTNVAMFRTPNPDIVVYWFYERGEGR